LPARGIMDSNAAITSVVARYLSSADFRTEMGVDRENALATCQLDSHARREFSEFDFATLESFGGLITKTQHNYLYEYLPYTRQLLRIYKLDLTIFAAYRTEIQSKPGPAASQAEKAARFIRYLRSWLEEKDDAYPGVADLLEHESILWDLKKEGAAATAEPAGTRARVRATRNTRPAIRRGVRLAEFRYNPFRIVDRLDRCGRPEKKLRRRYRLIYWIDSQRAQIRMAKPERTVWDVLRLCDGKRGLRSLYVKLAPLSPASVRSALAFAEASGFVQRGGPG
jgi:hypothetical protein